MSMSLPVSTSEWNASESIAALPETAAATNLAAAISRLPTIAATTARVVSLAIARGRRLLWDRGHAPIIRHPPLAPPTSQDLGSARADDGCARLTHLIRNLR